MGNYIFFSRDCLTNHTANKYFVLLLLGAFGPSIMGILVTAFFNGRSGIKSLLKKLTIWKVNPLFYIFVLFFMIVINYYIPLFIFNIIGEPFKLHSYINNPITIIGLFLEILVLGGPLGEEVGWRGFALPRFQNKLNPIFSAIVLGILWACWHLPLFFIHGSSQYGQPFIIFLIFTMVFSILITWVYNHTHGSLILPILFHAASNCTTGMIFNNGYNFYTYFQNHINLIIVQTILQLIVLLFIIFDMVKKSSNKVINTTV